jgi:hypothetical protein
VFVLDLVLLFWARACLDNAIDGIEEKRHLDPKRWHSRLLMHRRCCCWTWDEQVGLAAARALLDYRQRLCSFFSDAGLTLITRHHRGSRGSSVRRRSSRDHHRKEIEFQIEVFCFVSVCVLNQHSADSGFDYCVAESRILATFLRVLFLGLDPAAL